ncbi:hypothetical protein ACFO3O_04970 [Dokdonia ponticola]|uniref:Bacteriocin n=1 Tax=Dokdonia ponticola TaxID=2041041 RepID=A0ABV9HUN9_9FLAO
MLKKIKNIGNIVSKEQQREVNGGLSKGDTCNNPYINEGGPCNQGYYPHPVYGHCICCAY